MRIVVGGGEGGRSVEQKALQAGRAASQPARALRGGPRSRGQPTREGSDREAQGGVRSSRGGPKECTSHPRAWAVFAALLQR